MEHCKLFFHSQRKDPQGQKDCVAVTFIPVVRDRKDSVGGQEAMPCAGVGAHRQVAAGCMGRREA